MEKDLKLSALLDVYGSFLGEKQRRLTEYYYNDDLSLAEISENEGITRQGVRDAIKRAEIQLKTLEKDCGYCEKFARLKALGMKAKQNELTDYNELLDLIENL